MVCIYPGNKYVTKSNDYVWNDYRLLCRRVFAWFTGRWWTFTGLAAWKRCWWNTWHMDSLSAYPIDFRRPGGKCGDSLFHCGKSSKTGQIPFFINPMKNFPVIVFDFETTGLSPQYGDRAIEIGAVLIENKMVTDRFQSLMNPGSVPLLNHTRVSITTW